MTEIKSQEEYDIKRKQVLAKFKEDFIRNHYNYDPSFRSIAELLIRDINPYEVIERLIEDRAELVKSIKELLERIPNGRITNE